MTGAFGIVDAGLTAVATLATLGVVLVARNTLKASREANEQLRQSEASLRIVATATQASAKASEDAARVLTVLHESVVRDANVARARREAELARRALYRYRELEAIRLQLAVAGVANPINHPQYTSAREMFKLALRQIDEPDGRLTQAWNVANGSMDSGFGIQALGEIETELRHRDDALTALESEATTI